MSLVYYFVINAIGYFKLGRFVDLIQMDIVIILLLVIAVCEVKWHRGKKN